MMLMMESASVAQLIWRKKRKQQQWWNWLFFLSFFLSFFLFFFSCCCVLSECACMKTHLLIGKKDRSYSFGISSCFVFLKVHRAEKSRCKKHFVRKIVCFVFCWHESRLKNLTLIAKNSEKCHKVRISISFFRSSKNFPLLCLKRDEPCNSMCDFPPGGGGAPWFDRFLKFLEGKRSSQNRYCC